MNATFIAMNKAVCELIENISEDLKDSSSFEKTTIMLVDGNNLKTTLPYKYETIIKGDSKVFAIACASIIAKVTRDRMMLEFDGIFPQYGFKKHKGYPTAAHKEALREHGRCEIHRKSFRY